jgi:hypothetical protein
MGLEASHKETEREGIDEKNFTNFQAYSNTLNWYFLKDLIENFNGMVKLKKLKDAYTKLRVFEVSKSNYKSVEDSRGLKWSFS